MKFSSREEDKPGNASSCERIQEVAPGDFGSKTFSFERDLGDPISEIIKPSLRTVK